MQRDSGFGGDNFDDKNDNDGTDHRHLHNRRRTEHPQGRIGVSDAADDHITSRPHRHTCDDVANYHMQVLSMEDISRQLFQPDPRTKDIERNLSINETFSHFRLEVHITGLGGFERDTPCASAGDDGGTNGKVDAIGNKIYGKVVLPSYLDLRRRQNLDFVKSCTEKASVWISRWKSMQPGGNQFENEFARIETELRKALELIPDDVESLLLYSDLMLEYDCSSHTRSEPRKYTEKISKITKRVIRIDPGNVRAADILERSEHLQRFTSHRPFSSASALLSTIGGMGGDYVNNVDTRPLVVHSQSNNNRTRSSVQLTARESAAFQDALMERKLLESAAGMRHYDDDSDDNMSDAFSDDSKSNPRDKAVMKERKHTSRSRDDKKHSKKKKRRRKEDEYRDRKHGSLKDKKKKKKRKNR